MGNKLGEMVIVTKDKVISFFVLLVLLQISFLNAQDIETKKIFKPIFKMALESIAAFKLE